MNYPSVAMLAWQPMPGLASTKYPSITTTVVYIKDGDFHSHVLQTRSYYVS